MASHEPCDLGTINDVPTAHAGVSSQCRTPSALPEATLLLYLRSRLPAMAEPYVEDVFKISGVPTYTFVEPDECRPPSLVPSKK